MDDPVSDLGRHEAASAIAEALVALGGGTEREGWIDLAAVARVRSYIAAHASEQTPASTLERIAGIDRYAIARQFRRAYGTSPDRYRTMRRLRTARTAIETRAT
jgi:AraC-like DNA-binding protein